MKLQVDGDALAIMKDDFQDLQASDAVFINLPDAATVNQLEKLFEQERKANELKTKHFRDIVQKLLANDPCGKDAAFHTAATPCTEGTCIHAKVRKYLEKLK